MKRLVVVAHNLRSAHNVGSLLRTAEGLGVRVILSGYTPYPAVAEDNRLPHLSLKTNKQISKTALGAEAQAIWSRTEDISVVIHDLKNGGYKVIALEQTGEAAALPDFVFPEKAALILGREVEGIEPEVVQRCDGSVVIPMFGIKESFNVVQAAAMAMYAWRFS